MHLGSDPRQVLNEMSREREALREEVRLGSEAKGNSWFVRGWRPRAFKLWRLHVMVWVDGTGRPS